MQDKIQIHDRIFEKMIDASAIDSAVQRVAEQINNDYASASQPPMVIGILNGSFMFMSDLCKKLNFCPEISFVKFSSYVDTTSSGVVNNLIGINKPLEGRDVVVVEDIVDSGNTIVHINELLESMNPRSVKFCTLFLKPECYKKNIAVDYVAMEIGSEFIVGYGLDYNELGRNLQDIYVTRDE